MGHPSRFEALREFFSLVEVAMARKNTGAKNGKLGGRPAELRGTLPTTAPPVVRYFFEIREFCDKRFRDEGRSAYAFLVNGAEGVPVSPGTVVVLREGPQPSPEAPLEWEVYSPQEVQAMISG